MSDAINQKILEATDLVELIGDSVRLTKRGRNYVGLCPFHDEKTPSFTVTPDRGMWYCFGCGKGGDAFSFLMEKENMTFPEAVDYLAKRTGIEVPKTRAQMQTNDLYAVMEMAIDFYRETLNSQAGSVGRGYLARRNMTDDDAKRFELGWAPASWRPMSDALRQKGVTTEQLLKCGLVSQTEHGLFDRFRGRVIFPIRNVSGRAVALGGRIVDGEGAKYLNSPEGPIYSKKNNLYLLDRAKGAIRERKRSILVEGYMDAVRLHMHGFGETVASLGTALTEDQAALLKRFADKCYICYDADSAGQNATLRGMYILQRAGLQVFVVRFPGGKDPDEMLQTEGGDALFSQAVDSALPLVLYHIELFKGGGSQIKAADELLDDFAQLSPVEIAPFMREIAQAVGLPDYQISRELSRRREGRRPSVRSEDSLWDADGANQPGVEGDFDADDDENRPADQLEAGLLHMLWSSAAIREQSPMIETVKLFLDERMQNIAGALLSGTSPAVLERQWNEIGEKFAMRALASGALFCDTIPEGIHEKWKTLCAAQGIRAARARYEKLKALMLRGEATPQNIAEYTKLAMQIKRAPEDPQKAAENGRHSKYFDDLTKRLKKE